MRLRIRFNTKDLKISRLIFEFEDSIHGDAIHKAIAYLIENDLIDESFYQAYSYCAIVQEIIEM